MKNKEITPHEFRLVRQKLTKLIKGRTQREVAQKLNISQCHLSLVFRGKEYPSKVLAEKILNAPLTSVTVCCPHCDGKGRVLVENQEGGEVLAHEEEAPEVQTSPTDSKVKRLGKNQLAEIEVLNKVRLANWLEPLVVKVKKCVSCQCEFETTGNRLCGTCKYQSYPVVGGQEMIH